MDPSLPAGSSARPIPALSSSLMDKFLGLSVSPSSSDTTTSDANELDEEDIWGIEVSAGSYGDVTTSTGIATKSSTLPPRIFHGNRRFASGIIMENSKSPLKDLASASWISSTISHSPVSGTSSLSSTSSSPSLVNGGHAVQTARFLSGETATRRLPSASRMISRMAQHHADGNGNSNSSSGTHSHSLSHIGMIPQSAPLNIPDWSKLDSRHRYRHLRDDNDSEGEDGERLPPHEFLAREYARSQQTSFSVLEGAGRTLKGRDLRRVRNAVLTYTGFVE